MSTKTQLSYIQSMVEDLINENVESSQVNFHNYLQEKTREIILGEMCDDEDEDDDDDKKKKVKDEDDDGDEDEDEDKEKVDEAFAQSSEGAMSRKIEKIQYKKGGKKPAKTTEKCPKIEQIQYEKGGKKSAKTLEKILSPKKYSDGRSFKLGTT